MPPSTKKNAAVLRSITARLSASRKKSVKGGTLAPRVGSVLIGPALRGDQSALSNLPYVIRQRGKFAQDAMSKAADTIERLMKHGQKDAAMAEVKKIEALIKALES